MEKKLGRTLAAVILIFAAAVSGLLIANWAASQETYAATVASIDEKVETVLKLTATSTVSSAGISAIPGDTATPIAEKLADFTEYFLLILCVLYSEKYLLTVIGAGVFRILIPCACGLALIGLYGSSGVMKRLAVKIGAFGIALFIAIPTSIWISDAIYDTYQLSIDQTITAAEAFSEETAELSGQKDTGVIAAILDRISETASSLSDKAAKLMNRFIEALAVLIVTSCVIPVLVLLFFIWLIKMLTGIEVPVPASGGHWGKAKRNDTLQSGISVL